MKTKLILIILSILSFGIYSFGQTVLAHYTTQNTGSNGLSDNYVRAMIQTSQGDYWFSSRGADYYDGTNWVSYKVGSMCYFEDSNGKLWCGTAGTGNLAGLHYFQNNQWIAENDPIVYNISMYVIDIMEDVLGNLWVANRYGGIYKFDGQQWIDFTLSVPPPISSAHYCITQSHDSSMWFGTNKGAFCYNGTNWIIVDTGDGLANQQVNVIYSDKDSNLWFGTQNGLSKFKDSILINYTVNNGLADNYINDILQDSLGNLWFATNNGLSILNDTVWTNYTVNDGLPSNRINKIIINQAGQLVLATDKGLAYKNGNSWDLINTIDGLYDNEVYFIRQDTLDNMIFSVADGVSSYNGNNWHTYINVDSLDCYTVNDMLIKDNGDILVGTERGLRLCKGNIQNVVDSFITNRNVIGIVEDSNNNLWLATNNNGVYKYNGISWINYTLSDGLSSTHIRDICIDKNDNIWVNANEKINQFNGTNWIQHFTINNYSKNALFADDSGNVYIGDYEKYHIFDGNQWTTINDTILDNNTVSSFCMDKEGNLWIGASYKLIIKTNSGFKAVQLNNIPYWLWITDLYSDNNDFIWAGTYNGVIKFEQNVGIQKIEPFVNIFNVYPNPTSGRINLELGINYSEVQVIVRNSEGKLIKQHQIINKQSISIEIEGSKGIYFVEILSTDKRALIKVVKH